MTTTENKEDIKQKSCRLCHKSVSDRNALAMMCGRNEEPCSSKPMTTTSTRLPIRIEQVWLGFDPNVN
jgi:hypothetical protein